MKKFIRSYFLFLSEMPFAFNFFTWVVLLFLYLIIQGLTQEASGHPCFNASPLIIVTVILFINTLLIYWIRGKYITIKGDDIEYMDYLFTILLTADGEKIVLKKPVWKKGKKFIVTYRGGWFDEQEKKFWFKTSVSGKFYNTNISIPVTVELNLENGFDELEVFEELKKNKPDSEVLNITDYFIKMFNKINKNNQSEIEKEIVKFAKQEISESQLLNQVIDFINFPEKPFSNVKDVSIYLEKPEVTSCKGVSCPG